MVDLGEDVIHLIFKHFFSNFVTYEVPLSIYESIKDASDFSHTMEDNERTLRFENDDDFSKKTILISTGFEGTFGTLRFNEKSFFSTFLGFDSYWDYNPTNAIDADSRGVYIFEKITKLITTDIILLKIMLSAAV